MSIVIIDIGTHKAEELRIINGDRIYLLRMYLLWWYDWLKRQVKKVIKHKGRISYDGGAYKQSPLVFGAGNHKIILRQIISPTNYLKDIKSIALDPVYSITGHYLERLKLSVPVTYLPLAIIPHDVTDHSRLQKFFVSQNTLSSSINNYDKDEADITYVPAGRFSEIIHDLAKLGAFNMESQVILRMNCEGAEMAIIQQAIEMGLDIQFLLGSLGDIGKKYDMALETEAKQLLKENHIEYIYFKGSDPSTWNRAMDVFKSILQRL